jgi:GNAT superfamily N-acetyltransferase
MAGWCCEGGVMYRALDLYKQNEDQFPLIAAVLEGRQQGVVYSNHTAIPTHCFVINKFGFCQEFYSTHDQTFFNRIKEIIAKRDYSKLRCYAPRNTLKEYLDSCEYALLSERVQYEYKNIATESKKSLPGNLHIQDFAKKNANMNDFGLNLYNRYWNGFEDFYEHALAVIATDNDHVIGICYAAGIGLNRAEIDIYVDNDYRKSGIGYQLSRKFIKKVHGDNMIPSWDCYSNNNVSVKLSVQLGFKEINRYCFYNITGLNITS